MKTKKLSTRTMVITALLGALSYLLMLFKFPLPFMPPFMDFDFAAVPELIGTFVLGPVPGVFIVLIKLIIKMATMGTSSAFTGELINFMLSCALILSAWLIYNVKKTKKAAIWGISISVIITAVFACFANVYLIIPLYARLYGFDMNAVIEMTRAVNGSVDSVFKLVLFGILPFNIIKNGVAAAIVCPVLDRVRTVLSKRGGRTAS